MKKSISSLFNSKEINSTEVILGGAVGSKNCTDQVDTGATSYGTYDKETTPTGGGCDSSHTGWVGSNGEKDNPNVDGCGELVTRTNELSLASFEISTMKVSL